MPYHFTWLEEFSLSHVEMYGDFTMNDIDSWMEIVHASLNTHPDNYYTIIELKPDVKLKLLGLKAKSAIEVVQHPKFTFMVIVGINPLLAFWMQAIQQMTGVHFKTAPSVEEARTFIDGLRKIEREKALKTSA
jgi:hypothetical protein